MPLIFSYGSLQQRDVQLALLQRTLDGQEDLLRRFALGSVPIEDAAVAARVGRTAHLNAVYTDENADAVSGTAFEITDEELQRIDVFEAEFSYARVPVVLASGRGAWVYVHDPAA
ncbi:MAG TPA: gamma-glutamylcyclotransferase family protein [Vicinamibacterales bacterium]